MKKEIFWILVLLCFTSGCFYSRSWIGKRGPLYWERTDCQSPVDEDQFAEDFYECHYMSIWRQTHYNSISIFAFFYKDFWKWGGQAEESVLFEKCMSGREYQRKAVNVR